MTTCPASLSLPALDADDLLAISGANEGAPLGGEPQPVVGDIYKWRGKAPPRTIALDATRSEGLRLAAQTELGQPGARVHAVCVLHLMAQCGASTDVILLTQDSTADGGPQMFAVPVTPLVSRAEYRLVEVDHLRPLQVLAQMAAVSFLRGTHITLADGQQRRIEDLQTGDLILTRDGGAQPLRWVGRTTVRGVGALAPVRIEAGVLNNSRDLIISPEHHLLIYQRSDRLGVGRADVLVKARHLASQPAVHVDEGGFVEYYQLLFDCPQFVFAEGIAAETMRVTSCTAALLPAHLQQDGLHHRDAVPDGVEVGPDVLRQSDIIAVLQRALIGDGRVA